MPVRSSRSLPGKVFSEVNFALGNIIDAVKLPFRKERQLYRSFYEILGFYPRNLKLYRQALMHKSLTDVDGRRCRENNERLEYLGDAVLDAVVGDIVFRRFKKRREGFLTNVRSKVVQRSTLGRLAKEMGLTELIRSDLSTRNHNSYMGGNAFEAVVGAAYLDRGYEACLWFMRNRVLGRYLDLEKLAAKEENFKSRLLEWCQKARVEVVYVLKEEGAEGSSHSPFFVSCAVVAGVECGEGRGYSKKESQQKASAMALKNIRNDAALRRRILDTVKENEDNSTDKAGIPAEAAPAGLL